MLTFLQQEISRHNVADGYDMYLSPNIIRMIKTSTMRLTGQIAGIGETRGAYMALVHKPEGKRPHIRPGRRWKDNIKMVGCRDGRD